MQEKAAKCSCQGCGVHLEFPIQLEGSKIICPNCQIETSLVSSADGQCDNNRAEGAPADESEITAEEILTAFHGKVKWHGTSFLYQIGLLLVTAMIVTLPLVYVGLILLSAYGVYWWGRTFTFLLSGRHFGIHLMTLKFLLYGAPLFAGSVVVFFMLKPLLARRPSGVQPLALSPAAEPVLFALITRICQTIGAPFPKRIDVDCELNASAGFRRGFKSLVGNDLVLTIGLPLVAAMSATQLAGIIAHEFGHFTQGFAMRLTYIIRRVNGWFARVIYGRDEWDLMLEQWAAEAGDWRLQLLVSVARFGVWFSRFVLKGLMLVGIGSSSFVSRQMEYDADLYEIKFVGSRCFEESTLRMATFGESLRTAYKQMRVSWNSNKALPDNLPAFVMLHDRQMPLDRRTAVEDHVGLERATFFHTHPASGDRIAQARRADEAGVFRLDVPATRLFANFDAVARQVSLLQYVDEMEIPLPLIKLRPPESFFESTQSVAAVEEANTQRAELEGTYGPARLKLQR